jgi:hypothetical protein
MQIATSCADSFRRGGTAAMRWRSRIAIVLALILSACGGRPASTQPIGFINQTKHSNADLQSLWQQAQQNLLQQIDLNPLEQEMNNAAPHIVPGDPRASSVSPHQLIVSSQPDISAAEFYATTGTMRPDPTGLISCPAPCNVTYAPAYSLYAQPATRYAASWEFSGNNFDVLVEYEFENQILNALGYDTRWR